MNSKRGNINHIYTNITSLFELVTGQYYTQEGGRRKSPLQVLVTLFILLAMFQMFQLM